MWNKTRKRMPTKWCNVRTDWSLVKGFDINYLTLLFMSEQRQRRWVISVFIAKQKECTRQHSQRTKLITNTKTNCYRTDNQTLNKHSKQRSVFVLLKIIFCCSQEKRLLFSISTSPFLYNLRCHRRIHTMKTPTG